VHQIGFSLQDYIEMHGQQNTKFTLHQFDTVSTFSKFHSTVHDTEQCVFQKGSISLHGCTLSTSTCLFCLSHL